MAKIFGREKDGLVVLPFAEQLPNFQWWIPRVSQRHCAILPSQLAGLEAPWGMAQLTFMADSKRLPVQPQNMQELLNLAKRQAGRITYPRLPNFHGTTL
ncbi:MAG: hypothetical protein IPQ12_10260 [Polaromonas sp.]|nr:hypothetical protein [Polaromonas sp.]